MNGQTVGKIESLYFGEDTRLGKRRLSIETNLIYLKI